MIGKYSQTMFYFTRIKSLVPPHSMLCHQALKESIFFLKIYYADHASDNIIWCARVGVFNSITYNSVLI